MYLAPSYSEEEILKLLPEYAYLVRGLWVCKSSLLFNDGYASKRDKFLLEFTKKDSVNEKIVTDMFKSNESWMNRILFPLCKRRKAFKDFKFIFEADRSFLKHYPHVVNEQERVWSAREPTLRSSQETRSTVPRNTKNSTRSSALSKGPHPNMKKGKDGPPEDTDPIVEVLRTVFIAKKVRRSVCTILQMTLSVKSFWCVIVLSLPVCY
jgi:DNA-directed RNA polymerase III subunit RPC5